MGSDDASKSPEFHTLWNNDETKLCIKAISIPGLR